MQNFISLSIETHLFFARIMREHSLFLQAGFPCKDELWIQKADFYRIEFENLLRDVVALANGRVDSCLIDSNELVTKFTIPAEQKTSQFTGIPIDSRISESELALRAGNVRPDNKEFLGAIFHINERSLQLLNGLIDFKESILKEVQNCTLFTANYPLLIEHIIREAKLYRSTIEELMSNRRLSYQRLCETQLFWNQIMMEHALFIRGLLDPSEEQLIDTADDFANDYKELLETARRQDCRAMAQISLAKTIEYRDFKSAGAEGILDCKISSIILPLLADHVLREANHYIRLLECSRIG